MLKRVVGAGCWVLGIVACASTGDPPGGPPDRKPPVVMRVDPESGSVLTTPPSEVSIYFDEVINERIVGTPSEIKGAVMLSPTTEPERVRWHRDRVSVRPKSGFEANRVYRVEVFPVITDLRSNKMRAGRVIVFSTGPAIPASTLQGTVVDWVAGRPAVRALIEAVLMPDSLVYRTLADSAGVFRLDLLPPGEYRVYGIMDTNNDRRRGTREVYDSASVAAADTSAAPLELYAFVRDTTGPRLRQSDVVDSMTLKLTFDRPLDPTLVLDTSMVTVAPLDDSTSGLPVVGVFTQKELDSLRARVADTVTADSLRPAPDSVPADSARPARPDTLRPAAPVAPARPVARPGARAPLDSTRAEKMLARRPPPTDVRLVRLGVPLVPDTRYVIFARGVRSLSGNENDARGVVRPPRRAVAPPVNGAARDSVAAPDSTRADTTSAPRRP